ncbi:hypothetical protein QIH80_39380 [Bradyrhizobium elkanii]|nr:hypothetical protein QIH80_39380 [Bradyrhizobium elkanii]
MPVKAKQSAKTNEKPMNIMTMLAPLPTAKYSAADATVKPSVIAS